MRVSTDKNDALNFKPDVEDLESSEDEQENEEGGLYKAPRIAAAHYYEPGKVICKRVIPQFRAGHSTYVLFLGAAKTF